MSVGRRRPLGDPQLRAPPTPHHRSSSETLFPHPGSFLPRPRVCFSARCRYFPSPEPPRVPSILRLSVAGLAGSSPGSDLASASGLSGVDRTVSLLGELRAQDSLHTRGRGGPGTSETEPGGHLPYREQSQRAASRAVGPAWGRKGKV